jgi:hypothetical protein
LAAAEQPRPAREPSGRATRDERVDAARPGSERLRRRVPSQRSPEATQQADTVAQVRRGAGRRRATRASLGNAPRQRSRRSKPRTACAGPVASIFIRAMSTPVGQSRLQPLQLDAQGQRRLHRVAGQRLDGIHALELAGERQAQRVRPAAGQVLLVAGDAKARAHRAGVELAQWPLLLHISTALARPPLGSPPLPGAVVASVTGSFCTFHADQSSTVFRGMVRYAGG